MPAIAAADVDLVAFDLVVDVRPGASSRAAFPAAVPVDLDDLLTDPGTHIRDPALRVLVVCDVGVRSGLAADRLTAGGYPNVWSLAGGVEAWRSAGLPLDGGGLDADQLDRYDRQIKLAGIGIEGQRRLLDSTATVVGAGGLGLPVIAYLAAAGVGHLRVIDADRIGRSNLQRQPLFRPADIGRSKVEAVAEWVRGLDPALDVQPEDGELTAANARSLIAGSDVVIDATDRFAARYAVSDAAMASGIPVVSGAVYRWEGQVTVLIHTGSRWSTAPTPANSGDSFVMTISARPNSRSCPPSTLPPSTSHRSCSP